MTELHRGQTPPGQTFAKRWALYAAFGVPKIRLEDWRLTTKGLVEKELNLTFEDIEKLPWVKLTKDFHCLAPGEFVFANPEPKPVEEIRVGDRIIGRDGRCHRVRSILRKKHFGRLLKIKASYLPELAVTPDHKVWAIKGHKGIGKTRSQRLKQTFRRNPTPTWIPANELKIGDYVFFPRYRQMDRRRGVTVDGEKIRLTKAFADLLGWYVAEGSGGDSEGRVVAFSLHRDQRLPARRLARELRHVFGAQISVYNQHNVRRVTVTSSRTRNLSRLLKTWCGNNASSKRIPDFILNSEPRILRSFLSALIKGDGYCPWRLPTKKSPKSREDFLEITTLSTKLAYQLILALSKLGIAAGLVKHRGSVRDSWSVRVRGVDQIRRIFPRESLPRPHKINRRRFWQTTNGFYFPIQRIQNSRYNGQVYDFTADGYTMLSPFATLDCVTSWSIKDVVWEGVLFREVAKLTGVKPEAKWVMFHCADGYTAPVPLEDAMVEDSLIAFRLNGKPLKAEQGFPARPFIPHLYGWKSAKWLTGVEFMREYKDGYWELYAYHERGNVWDEERFKGQGGRHVRHRGLGTIPV